MAFWCRIKQSKLKCLSHQFKRCYLQIPYSCSVHYTTSHAKFCVIEKPDWIIPKRPTEFCNNSRFFAAPVQAKPKQEEDPSGPLLNDQIRAKFVRLVTDEGHSIVSRNEALERARKLKLDLVEVQRKTDPPVCKIMDFNREKYKQQVKEKDRAKSKSELTLKKGDGKEVRFSGKCEQKDLQMKADTAKRLMERGYRVKCMAMGTEDQDLGGLLSRLSDLIEDVSIVESGPRVEKKMAYVIVRHIKFGPSKKGSGKKASKVVGVTSTEVQKATTVPPIVKPSSPIQTPIQFEEDLNSAESGLETNDTILSDVEDTPISPSMGMPDKNLEENKTTWSVSNASDDFDNLFGFSDDGKGLTSNSTDKEMNTAPETVSSPANTYTPDFLHLKPVLDSTRANTAPSSPPVLPLATENRYSRNEPRNRIPPTKAIENKGTGATDSARLEPQFPNQGRLPRSDLNAVPSTVETKRVETDASVFRNLKLPPNEIPKQEQSRHGSPSSAVPSYGAFSAPKANVPGQHGVSAEVIRNKEENPFYSTDPGRLEPNLPSQGMQQRYDLNVSPSTKQVGTDGSISRNSKLPPNEVPKQEPSRPGPPSSAGPSYGAFSAPKGNAPTKQGVSAEVIRNKEEKPFYSTDPGRLEPNFPSQGMQQRYDLNVSPSTKQVGTDGSISRNSKLPPNEVPKQEPSRPGPPSSAGPSYGAFSAPKGNAPTKQGVPAEVIRNNEGNSFNSTDGIQQRYDLNISPSTKQVGNDGSISRNSKLPPNEVPKQEQSRPGPPTSTAPSYGIFSARKANAPGKPS